MAIPRTSLDPKRETRPLGVGGPELPRLGFGACPLGGHDWGPVDDVAARAAVAHAAGLGLDFFDTADCYGLGRSEVALAEALGSRRRDVVIATKGGVRWDDGGRTWRDASADYLVTAVHASLKRLAIDVIPLYYLHWPDGRTPIEDSVEALDRLRERGLLQRIGVSNVSASEFRRAAAVAPISAVQVRGSLVRRAACRDVVAPAHAVGAAVVSWGSLGEGLLSAKYDENTTFGTDDRRSRYEDFKGEHLRRGLAAADRLREVARRIGSSPARVALRWLLDNPGIDFVLFGAKTPEQVQDNCGALGWSLDPGDHDLLSDCETHD